MTDLFADKADAWDTRPVPVQISTGVLAAIRERVPLSPSTTVLDFGAGTGLLAAGLAPEIGTLHAVDISRSMLAQLVQKEALRDKAVAHCQDIVNEPLDIEVDLIVSAMAMHHVQDTAALMRAFRDHLRPGGRVALADLDAEDGSFHPPEAEGVCHAGFDREALGGLLREAGFDEVAFETATTVSREGGSYPIFLVTARRG